MRLRHVSLLVLLALADVWCGITQAQEQATILAVVEDTPGHYSGDPHYRSVRVVFRKEAREWQAFPSACLGQECAAKYPSGVNWTVAFDGRSVGQITTRNGDGFRFYSDVGQQSIAKADLVPTIGNPSQDFAGFLGTPVYRPLVAVSKPYFHDPERWKTVQLSPTVVGPLRKQFRQRFPTVANCTNSEENIDKPWPYHDDDIKVIRAYSSNENWSIARLRLDEYRCDGPADAAFVDQWFVISPSQELRFLDKAMWLVDAGDYDNDGKSELLFSIDDYNRGGYKLFYDHFQKEAIFEFSYH
jgi:hypothetical protein